MILYMKRKNIVPVFLGLTFIIMMMARMYLVINRYYDADEFAHLHWAYLIFAGFMPYRDFFMNTTPVYQIINLPVFLGLWSGFTLVLARLFQVPVYLSILYFIYSITFMITASSTAGLLSIVIFTVFPMIFIKSIEVRPDILMTAFYMAGIWYLLKCYRRHDLSNRNLFWAGCILGLSVLTMAKMATGIPAVLIFFVGRWNTTTIKKIYPWAIGFFLPVSLFLFFTILTGTTQSAWEHIINGSKLIKAGEGAFSPWKSLSPYPYVYVYEAGPSIPWYVNSALWIISIPGLIWMFLKFRFYGILLLFIILGNIAGLFIFPTPFMQYFIPICAVLSITGSFFIYEISNQKVLKKFGIVFYIIPVIFLVWSFWVQFFYMKPLDMAEQSQVLDDIAVHTRPLETFYDMVGSYVFRSDGYFICCNIYPHISPYLQKNPGSLKESLIKNKTKFIVMDRVGKSFWLPSEQDLIFMKANYQESKYRKIYALGVKFRCVSGVCTRVDTFGKDLNNFSGDAFDLPIAENYEIKITPMTASINLNGRKYANGEKVKLETGYYWFTVSENVEEFAVLIDR
jgi:hypothetical protein